MMKITEELFKRATKDRPIHGLMDIGDGKLKPVWVTGIADGIVRYQVNYYDGSLYMDEKAFMMRNVYENPF